MNILTSDSINPYQSPSLNDRLPKVYPEGLVRRGFLYRRIRLTSPFNVDVEYNACALGCEYVLVNGVLAKKQSHPWYSMSLVIPHIDFEMKTAAGTFSSSLDVRVRLWFAIRYLSLKIEGNEVYCEGSP